MINRGWNPRAHVINCIPTPKWVEPGDLCSIYLEIDSSLHCVVIGMTIPLQGRR